MKVLILLIITAFSISAVNGQDEKVTAGIEKYSQSEYQQALEILNAALSNPALLAKENLPAAYYYRAKTQMGLYHKFKSQADVASETQGKALFFQAYEDYENAKRADDGKWSLKIQADLQILNTSALQGAQSAINSSYNTTSHSQKSSFASEAEKYASVAIGINDSEYIAYDFLGQALLEQGKASQAIQEFSNAQKSYEQSGKIDFLMGYTYYRSALAHKNYLNDLESALKEIQKGQKILEADFQRSANSTNADPKLLGQFNRAKDDLKNFELDLYMNSPQKLGEAIEVFENHLEADPNNYNKIVAYASLLEQVDKQKAADAYKRAVALDSNNEVANFNLGALYNNLAAQLSKKAVEEPDLIKANEFQSEAISYLQTALPYFEKAFEANASIQTAQALVQICSSLEMDDKHAFYKEKESELTMN